MADKGEVKKLGPNEQPEYNDFRARAGKSPASNRLNKPHAVVVGALNEDGTVVGADEADISGSAAYQHDLYVEPDARRRGLGARLVNSLLGVLFARGVKEVFTEIDVTNEASIQLHLQEGYQIVGHTQTKDGSITFARMRKRLQE